MIEICTDYEGYTKWINGLNEIIKGDVPLIYKKLLKGLITLYANKILRKSECDSSGGTSC